MKQTILELVIAFALCWMGAFALSGCVVEQAQAYKTIQGVK